MSAWLCSDDHVAVIAVTIKNNVREYHGVSVSTIAQMLHDENIKSLVSRYGEADKENRRIMSDRIPSVYLELSPLALVKLIDSYCYQSCEHQAWPLSKAYKAVKDAKNVLVGKAYDKECGDKYWKI